MSAQGPRPAYDEAYFKDTFGRDAIRFGSVAWWSIRLYAKLAARRLARSAGRRVLDVGCAHGYILARLEREFETYGVDLSGYAVEKSRAIAPRSRIVQGDVEQGIPLEFRDLRFDLIIARYVLEHMKDPPALLAGFAAALAPGGAALVSVPNTASPGRRFKGADWFGYRDPTHVSLLPPEDWIQAIEQAGLTIETRCSDGLWDVPYIAGPPALLQYVIFSLPAALEALLARPILPVSWGENLILIAGLGARRGQGSSS